MSNRTPSLAARDETDTRVSSLELFFDLVFVLALTQATAFMAYKPTFLGIAEGLVVLALVWWSWVGYSWLTSVVDPERLAVRVPIFATMAAFLVASIAIPDIRGDSVWFFVGAYAVVRILQVVLFALGSQGDRNLVRSITILGTSTFVGLAVLATGAAFEGHVRFAFWGAAIALDMLGPYLFGAEGWKLVPGHFAERHGLILIIALGESIVALGLGAGAHVTIGVAFAAVLGIVVVSAMWWVYFDVLAHAAEHRLAHLPAGRECNEAARDAYSFLHLPMMAGIVLVALGLKKTLAHVDEPLTMATGTALAGGVALYLLGRTAFGRRIMGSYSRDHFWASAGVLAVLPFVARIPSLATLAYITVILVLLVMFKLRAFGDRRSEVRERAFGTDTPDAAADGDPSAEPSSSEHDSADGDTP